MNRALVVVALLLACPVAAEAQRLAPTGMSAFRSDVVLPTRAGHDSASVLARPLVAESPAATPSPSRGGNAGRGALIGAAVLGIAVGIAASHDHSGEGLILPVVLASGAVVGAVIGGLIGLVWPN